VIAFRKTNGMSRTGGSTSAKGFAMLLSGDGGYKLKYPKAGKHVEADLSRQVLVLARDGKPERIYHTASGAPATPTILGSYTFYRKSPGTNAKGMVHSSYFIRGYAIHGYKSVPTGPASHGCLRVPIMSARSIFDWINLGDRIYVYR
jgi:lipoprotein-anchoring transpeptidase ErfK/SrfK